MNEVLKTIAGRRSIRQYREEQIKDAELKAILEAGLQAPSGHDSQPWHFTVIQKRELIDEISAGSKTAMRQSGVDWIVKLGEAEKYNIFYNAPTVVLAGGQKRRLVAGRRRERGPAEHGHRRREPGHRLLLDGLRPLLFPRREQLQKDRHPRGL